MLSGTQNYWRDGCLECVNRSSSLVWKSLTAVVSSLLADSKVSTVGYQHNEKTRPPTGAVLSAAASKSNPPHDMIQGSPHRNHDRRGPHGDEQGRNGGNNTAGYKENDQQTARIGSGTPRSLQFYC